MTKPVQRESDLVNGEPEPDAASTITVRVISLPDALDAAEAYVGISAPGVTSLRLIQVPDLPSGSSVATSPASHATVTTTSTVLPDSVVAGALTHLVSDPAPQTVVSARSPLLPESVVGSTLTDMVLEQTPQPSVNPTSSLLPESDVTTSLANGALDPGLAEAALSAAQTGNFTPLIKKELRYAIQNKRLLDGKDELQVEYKIKQLEKLTPEEEERRRRRRERNKVAAQRCRKKRRTLAEELEKESLDLEGANERLKSQVALLEKEKRQLEMMLMTHDLAVTSENAKGKRSHSSCSMRLSTSTVDDDELNDLFLIDPEEDQVVR